MKCHGEDDADDCSGEDVIHDYAPAVGEFLDGVDGAGFPDVEEAEEGEGGEGPPTRGAARRSGIRAR